MKRIPNNSMCWALNDGFGCPLYQNNTIEDCTECLKETIKELKESIKDMKNNPKDYI